MQHQVGFKGTLQQFFVANRRIQALLRHPTPRVLADFEAARTKIDARLPLLFNVKPKADYVIKAIPEFMEQSQPGGSLQLAFCRRLAPGPAVDQHLSAEERERFVRNHDIAARSLPRPSFSEHGVAGSADDLPAFRRFDESTAYRRGLGAVRGDRSATRSACMRIRGRTTAISTTRPSAPTAWSSIRACTRWAGPASGRSSG